VNVLIDTNRYRDFCEGKPDALDIVQRARSLAMPFVALAELRAGFLCGTLARQNEQTLTRFLNSDRVHILFPDEDTTHHFARIFAQLRLQGTPIPVNDIWIAALAVQHDLILFTRDSHFDALPQIARC
jgi:tRNA(fMet)-specific endonuclease VapC